MQDVILPPCIPVKPSVDAVQTFDSPRAGTGTAEWAEHNLNIARGCSHNCLYCYAAANAVRFKLKERADWPNEELTKNAALTRYPARKGVVMFPTTHDITPNIVNEYIRVAKLVLAAGNRLLIVSKPHFECIQKVVAELDDYKEQIMFRFTIGSTDDAVLKLWEPGAPGAEERIASLKFAFDAGFRTSVSAEPLLGGISTALNVLAAVEDYVTDTVWIGKMNRARQRVDMTSAAYSDAVEEIESLQTDTKIIALYARLKKHPKVAWKDSVTEVVGSYNLERTEE